MASIDSTISLVANQLHDKIEHSYIATQSLDCICTHVSYTCMFLQCIAPYNSHMHTCVATM